MDYRIDRDYFRISRWFPSRIPALPKPPAWLSRGLPRSTKRVIAGISLLILAACAAVWAEDLAQSSAFSDFERAHSPSLAVWTYALASTGFRRTTEPQAIQRAIRHLPSSMDLPGSVWISQDSDWIVAFPPEEQSIPEAVFCLECKREPSDWHPLGRAWTAFETAIVQASAHAVSVRATLKPRKTVVFHDPREVRY